MLAPLDFIPSRQPICCGHFRKRLFPVRYGFCDLFQADSQHCSCDSIQTLLVPFYMDGPLGMHDRLARTESLRCGQ